MKLMVLLLRFFLSPLAALAPPTTLVPQQDLPPSPLGTVYLIADVDMEAKTVSAKAGRPIFGLHTSLQIGGTSVDGPLRVETGFNQHSKLQIRASSFGVAQSGRLIGFWG